MSGAHHRAMRIADFALERYFAKWEFAVQHVLCASDVEGWSMAELLALADDETAAMWGGLRLGYTKSTGHPLLRREIAALYETIGADDVLVFAGAEEAVFCLMTTSLEPGDHVVVTWPGYQSLYEVARAVGAKVGLHVLREEDGWALDVDRLVRSFHDDTRMVVVNAPHNPTGMLPTPEEWRRLAAECSSRGIRIVADEVYRFLEHDGAPTLPAGADLDERAVSIGVMSKSFALAGLRIGWLATRDRAVLDRCARMKDYTTICSSAPSEVLALIALRARERVLDRSRSIVVGQPCRPGRLLRSPCGRAHLGAAAGRLDRLPEARSRRPGWLIRRRVRRPPRRGERRPAAALVDLWLRRFAFPHRARPNGPAGGGREAGGLPVRLRRAAHADTRGDAPRSARHRRMPGIMTGPPSVGNASDFDPGSSPLRNRTPAPPSHSR